MKSEMEDILISFSSCSCICSPKRFKSMFNPFLTGNLKSGTWHICKKGAFFMLLSDSMLFMNMSV